LEKQSEDEIKEYANPVAKIKYANDIRDFTYDTDYSLKVLKEIENENKKLAQEKKRKEEEEKARKAEEEKQRIIAEAQKRKEEEEAKRIALEETRKKEEERLRKEAEERRTGRGKEKQEDQKKLEEQRQKAEEEARRLAEAFADDVEALDLQAAVHRLSGRSDEAVETWKRCLVLRPDFLRAYVPMISIARRKGDYAEAERLCRECLRLDPLQVEARGLLAAVLFEQGQYDAAIETVLAGYAIGAVDAEALFFQGQAYQKSKSTRRRRRPREAIRLEPNYTARIMPSPSA